MSRAEADSVETARALLKAETEREGGPSFASISRDMGGEPTRQALMDFAKGGTTNARYWKRLLRVLRGESDQPDLAEEAAEALALVREAEQALKRVVQRIQQLPATPDQAAQIAALDDPMPSESQSPAGKRKRGMSG